MWKSALLSLCAVLVAIQLTLAHAGHEARHYKDLRFHGARLLRRTARQFGPVNEELIPICTRPKAAQLFPELVRTSPPTPRPTPRSTTTTTSSPPSPQEKEEISNLEKELVDEFSKTKKPAESPKKSYTDASLTAKEKEVVQMLGRPYKVYGDGKDKVIWLPAPPKIVDTEGRVLRPSASSDDEVKVSDSEQKSGEAQDD